MFIFNLTFSLLFYFFCNFVEKKLSLSLRTLTGPVISLISPDCEMGLFQHRSHLDLVPLGIQYPARCIYAGTDYKHHANNLSFLSFCFLSILSASVFMLFNLYKNKNYKISQNVKIIYRSTYVVYLFELRRLGIVLVAQW